MITAESIRLLAILVTTLVIGMLSAHFGFFDPAQVTWPPTLIGGVAGWVTFFVIVAALLYSLRKRKLFQIPGRLIHWKFAHVIFGFTALLTLFWHSALRPGIGMQWFLTVTTLLLALSGLYGVLRQAYLPRVMNKTLIDPVYKTAIREDVAHLEEEIDTLMRDRSEPFIKLYQRHLLPLLSIERPDHDQQKGALKRLFGKAESGPTAAIHDVDLLEPGERKIYFIIAEKVIDIIERRRCQAYQGLMNGWLVLHITLAILLTGFLFFHILASFYY